MKRRWIVERFCATAERSAVDALARFLEDADRISLVETEGRWDLSARFPSFVAADPSGTVVRDGWALGEILDAEVHTRTLDRIGLLPREIIDGYQTEVRIRVPRRYDSA
jgi:hypothetical protein